MRYVQIGCGGIGGILANHMNRIVGNQDILWLIDGDKFEEKNRDRQDFKELRNKAEEVQSRMKCNTKFVPEFITKKSKDLFKDNDTVLMCVDNHATRLLVSKFCQKLENVILISGGNESTDGNVQVYIKRRGKEITEPIEKYHPEIQKPSDRNPGDSCDRVSESEPQIYFTNNTVATIMANLAFRFTMADKYGYFDKEYSEYYFDILINKVDGVKR